MGLIREPLEVDFFFDPKPLTKDDQKMISDFIKVDKAKRKLKKNLKKAHTHNSGYKQKASRRALSAHTRNHCVQRRTISC